MDHDTSTRQDGLTALHDIARQSFDAARNLNPNQRQRERLGAVASSVVGGIVERAQAAAVAVVTPARGDTSAVWAGVLEALEETGLSPVLYCRKTGRRLGLVTPEPWQDYLHTLAALGETNLADETQGRLIAAIVAQKAHTVAPVVLVSCSASLAMIRETSPADFLAIALGDIFPLPRSSQSTEQAQRNERLGQARAAMEKLPSAALQYACETVGLFLSYVKPHLIPTDCNLLGAYGSGASADLVLPVSSVSALGHFCGRLVQSMVKLIGQANLKPVDKLTSRDLAALRVHWRGDANYQNLRLSRSLLRQSKSAALRLQRLPVLMTKGAARIVAGVDSSLLSDFGAALMLDALDLSFASGAMGQSLPVKLESEVQADIALARQADLRSMQEYREELGGVLDLLDLSGLLVSGSLPDEFLPTIERESDLAAIGLDFDAVADSGWLPDDEQDDEQDGEAALPDWLQAFAIDQAKPTKPVAPKPAPKPSRYAGALAIAAEFGLTDTQPQPARRVILSPGASVTGPSAQVAVPAASPIRRVIKG